MNLASGFLTTYFYDSLILTIPVSLLLLARYRRALLRGMLAPVASDDSPAGEPGSVVAGAPAAGAPVAGAPAAGASEEPPDTRASRRRLIVLYSLATLAASGVTTPLIFIHDVMEPSLVRVALVGYGTTWTLAATLPAVLALSRRQAAGLAVAWYLGGAALAAVFGLFASEQTALGMVGLYSAFVALTALPPWIIVLVTGSRKLRPVSPIVLSGMLVFSFSAFFVHRGFVNAFDHPALRDLLLGIPWADKVWFLVASLPVGLACWLVARWLSRRYEAKSFSDTQLLVDTWWLISAFYWSAFFAVVIGWSGLVGLGAFVAYRVTMEIGFRLWPRPGTAAAGRRLLLPRVFGFRKRTERLFDAIAKRWRFSGAVQLITGTDLAGRTVDPGEIIRFLAGDTGAQFVHGRADLERRLRALDIAPDPDGRFRVNDFSCHDATWKLALEGLLERSDVVLMDLRGFSSERSGCRFELEKLAETGRLARTLFVVDDSTDVELLRATVTGESEPHLVRVERQSGARLAAVEAKLSALAA